MLIFSKVKNTNIQAIFICLVVFVNELFYYLFQTFVWFLLFRVDKKNHNWFIRLFKNLMYEIFAHNFSNFLALVVFNLLAFVGGIYSLHLNIINKLY